MLAILSKLVIVLMVVMLVPTGLVLASQEAVPGDATYPVKRGLEGVIITLASVHPATRAFFHTDLTKRRFKEAIALIRRGRDASDSLVELVTQTQEAADIIDKIPDRVAKKAYIENLSTRIVEYKVSLKKLEDGGKVPEVPAVIVPPARTEPTLQPAIDNRPAEIKISQAPKSISPTPEIYVTPKVESLPTSTPVKSEVITTTQPVPVIPTTLPPTIIPTHSPSGGLTSTPRPTVLPTPPPTNIDECGRVGNTSDCLERILKRICDKNPDLQVCQSRSIQIRSRAVPKSLDADTQNSVEIPRLGEGQDEIEASDDNVDAQTNPNKGKNNSKNR